MRIRSSLAPLLIAIGTIVIAFAMRDLNFDFTLNRAFSLSKISTRTVKSLPEKMEIEYFHSLAAASEEPIMRMRIKQVKALLKKYEKASGGKIKIIETETRELSDEEMRAMQYGLKPMRENENKLSPIYSGLVLRNRNHEFAIPLLGGQKNQSFEYEITHAISQFVENSQKPIAIISSLDWFAPQNPDANSGIASIAQEIILNKPVQRMGSDWVKIPDVNSLFIAQSNAISEGQNNQIISYINAGKSAFVCLDPASSVSHDNNNGAAIYDQSLAKMLHYFGLNLNGEIVMDKGNALRIATNNSGKDKIMPQPLFFSSDLKSPIFGQIGAVNFATSGFVEISPKPEFEYETLFSTSKESGKISAAQALANQSPSQLIREFESQNQEFSIAVMVKSKNKARGNLILVADCDFLSDGLYTNSEGEAASNADFVLGAIDYINNSPEMAELRAKGIKSHNISQIDSIKAKAESEITIQEGILNQRIESLNQEIASNPNSPQITYMRDEITKSRNELRTLKEGVKRNIQGLKNLIIFICGFLIPFSALIFGVFIYWRRNYAQNS